MFREWYNFIFKLIEREGQLNGSSFSIATNLLRRSLIQRRKIIPSIIGHYIICVVELHCGTVIKANSDHIGCLFILYKKEPNDCNKNNDNFVFLFKMSLGTFKLHFKGQLVMSLNVFNCNCMGDIKKICTFWRGSGSWV